jgi:DNA-binding MarR family transcriptional regulator/GNAT superfamily N-acetyltransferase
MLDVGDEKIAAVRAFSRFYTRRVGVLHEGLLGSPFSLAEGRVIWEIAQTDATTATALITSLGLDAGYLSRILRGLEARALIARRPDFSDARQSVITLTPEGRDAYAAINARSRDEIAAMLERLSAADQARLVAALATAENLLGEGPVRPSDIVLRAHRPGDIGWMISRQAALYAEEYGWDISFETLLAEIGANFIRGFDPAREACWIAEVVGVPLGGVCVVRHGEDVAKLRMLFVERAARGWGLGRRLVDTCIAFARDRGYRRMTLWTNDVLVAARAIYASAGFSLVAVDPPAVAFGQRLVSETWDLDL